MITTDNEILRKKCDPATLDEAKNIIHLLDEELIRLARLGSGGIGLAAPQISIHKRVAIIRLNESTKINLVNCKIEKMYDKFLFKGEGCLSIPGKLEDTMRFNEVHITNNLVEPHSFIATGLIAVVCQHEIDHLNGILFTDHMDKPIFNKIKVGPNDRCICGSNIKYKKCCMKGRK